MGRKGDDGGEGGEAVVYFELVGFGGGVTAQEFTEYVAL